MKAKSKQALCPGDWSDSNFVLKSKASFQAYSQPLSKKKNPSPSASNKTKYWLLLSLIIHKKELGTIYVQTVCIEVKQSLYEGYK